MRILTFLHSFEPGGVERVALRLAGAWANAGHEVVVAVGRRDGPQAVIAPENVSYDFARTSRLAKPFETLWLVWHLMRAIRRQEPDILFCPGSTYTVVAALVHLFMADACPPIVAKLSNSLERRDLPFWARAAYRLWLRDHPNFIAYAVGMAPPMREEIRKHLNMTPDRIAIVPDAALDCKDLSSLSAASPNTGGRRYVAAGRLTAQKNPALLLRAFAAVAKADDRLLILGDGPQRRKLVSLAERLNISTQIEMPGHVQSVAQALASADVFVMSSDYEGLPAVIVQALAAGLSIVATDCSVSMRYLLADGALGNLVPIRDVKALAEAMQSAPNRDELDVLAMQAMAGQFIVDSSAELYIEVFGQAIARARTTWEPLAEAPVAQAV